MKEIVKNKTKLTKTKESLKNFYIVEVECDANDGDYMKERYELSDIYNNELDLLVLCLLDNGYGRHINSSGYFPWIVDYCMEEGYLLFCGAIDDYCHSTSISISYVDEKGDVYDVELPTLSEIFGTKEKGIDYLNNLAEKHGYK